MNLTYARSRFKLKPEERKKVRADKFADKSELHKRIMPERAYSKGVAPPKKIEPNRAKRHRLNEGRRTVEENRKAR